MASQAQKQRDDDQIVVAPAGTKLSSKTKNAENKNSQEFEEFEKQQKQKKSEYEELAARDIEKSANGSDMPIDWLPEHFKKCQKRSSDGMPIVEMKNGECHYHLENDKRLIEKEDRLQIHGKLDKKDFDALAQSLYQKGWVPANVEGSPEFVSQMIKAMAEHAPPITIAKETLTPDLFDEWEKHRENKYGSQYQEYAKKMHMDEDQIENEKHDLLLSPAGKTSDLQKIASNENNYEPIKGDKETAQKILEVHINKLQNLRGEEDPEKITDAIMANKSEGQTLLNRSRLEIEKTRQKIQQINDEIQNNRTLQTGLAVKIDGSWIGEKKIFGTGRTISGLINTATFGKIKTLNTSVALQNTKKDLEKKLSYESRQEQNAITISEKERREAKAQAIITAKENHKRNSENDAHIKKAQEVKKLINIKHAASISAICSSSPMDMHKAVEKALNLRKIELKKEPSLAVIHRKKQKEIER